MRVLCVCASLLLVLTARAFAGLGAADNFVLLDHKGVAHELYYDQEAPAIVLMIQGNGCPIVRNAWTDYKAVRDAFADKGVLFYMLNANRQDDRVEIVAEAEEFGYDTPILKDESQLIAASLNVTRTAEVLVIDPVSRQIVYRGPVNDRLGYERQRAEAGENYLSDALNAVIAGEEIETPKRRAKGCIVNLRRANESLRPEQISYSETIAPLLKQHCVTCHQEGGIAPWAMSDYDMVEGFSLMIREVLRTNRMPPWSADPHIGVFKESRALSVEEKRTLVQWIEAGALRGDGPDPLAERESTAVEWPLGPPDLIVEAPAFEVPASGVIDYQFPFVANPLGRDVWVRAVSILPGDVEVVHHALVGSTERTIAPGEGDDSDVFENYLAGYVPGAPATQYPKDGGVFVKAGGGFVFQMHYTPNGRASVDRTKLGLYFFDTPPKHTLRNQVAINPRINIPANAPRHEEKAYFEFDQAAVIYKLFPHAHYRGWSSKFELAYPDGRVETILSVPRYDFNWQHSYSFQEPVQAPAGSRLIHRTVYDNSENNFANPDPNRDVGWGLQSEDEMLYGGFMFRWAEETRDNPIHDHLQFTARQFFGFMDADMDGRLVPREMWSDMRKAWDSGRLKLADRDKDGALAFEEYYGLRKFMASRGGE